MSVELEHPTVVIDTETTGIDPRKDILVEVAWWRLDIDECGVFVPPHDVSLVLEHGTPRALEINHYKERLVTAPQDIGNVELTRLAKALDRNTWLGAKPAFDVGFLTPVFEAAGFTTPFWFHGLWDICAYAAGVLRLRHIPSLLEICELLKLPPGDHTAKGDVVAIGRCMKALMDR